MLKYVSVQAAIVAAMVMLVVFMSIGNAHAGSMKVVSGEFTGASDHVTSGNVSVVEKDGNMMLVLAPDFSLDGAPDPKLGFGISGEYDPKGKVAHLKKKSGSQEYMIPAGIDVSKYDEIYVWCEKYSVPLGVAKLK